MVLYQPRNKKNDDDALNELYSKKILPRKKTMQKFAAKGFDLAT